jgi:hypothetical protein
MCRPCHNERLIEAHEERIAELEAKRPLWEAQQRAHRLRQEAQ